LWAFPITNYAIGDGLLNAKIEDERGKLNLNDLAVAGNPIDKKTRVDRVKRLFQLIQVNPDLVDAIVDWVDHDENPEPSGVESLYYQTLRPSYLAANEPLQTLLELRLIKGMTPEIMAKLSKLVTVYPSQGPSKVNLNTADPLVIQALHPDITQSVAADIIQSRPYKTIQELDRVSSFDNIRLQLSSQNLYDVNSNLFLARMTVKVNEVTRNAVVVLQRDPSTGMSTVQYYRVL
jgi:general secretion pathway protein K